MKRFLLFLCFFSLVFSSPLELFTVPPEGCTTIMVGPKASKDGSHTTHTNDCKDCDFRLSRVPAATHEKGSKRMVPLTRFAYPRYVGYDRGETLKPEYVDRSIFDWNLTEAMGYVPQVSQTFAYLDGVYGIINEKQVAIGESTCAGRLVAKPLSAGGFALFDVAELSRIAMERASTAREAIKIMGGLAEEYGFYGAEWEGDMGYAESGEALNIIDPNEAWLFQILPDDTGKSAVWVAQRIPDDHVAVVANAFTIKEIDLKKPDWFMASSNVFDVALRNSFWDGVSPFSFTAAYAAKIAFEVYCSRRMWRVYDLWAPSLKLDAYASVLQLPTSVKPDRILSANDVMWVQRDHYEGSEFDLTKGLAAGPYGNPNRYDRGAASGTPMNVLYQGTFERAISLFRTAYSFVALSRSWLPDDVGASLWFAHAAPHASVYIPLYPALPELPDSLTRGSLYRFDRESHWWAVTAVSNYMERMFSHIRVDVERAQREMEATLISMQAQVESDSDKTKLAEFQSFSGASATRAWWGLFEFLLTKFHDGYRLDDFHAQTIDPQSLFYPLEWLEQVNFFPQPVDVNRTVHYIVDPYAVPYLGWSESNSQNRPSKPFQASLDPLPRPDKSASSTGVSAFFVVSIVLTALLCTTFGWYIGKRSVDNIRDD